jgi:hypothetical protein
MKFSLSNLFLIVTVVAVALGWWCDHTRLRNTNARLNAEAAALFQEANNAGSTITALGFPNGELPPSRAYDFLPPQNRAEYRKTYGHRGKTGSGFMADNLISSLRDR